MIDRSPLQVGERWVNPLPDEASSTKWEPEKKDPLRGYFFSYWPSAGTAPSAPPPSQLDGPCAPPGVPRTTGSTLRLSTYSFFYEYGRSIDRLFRSGNVGLTHSLMKHLVRSGNQKKKDPLTTGSPLRPGRRPTHDWIDVAPIHV